MAEGKLPIKAGNSQNLFTQKSGYFSFDFLKTVIKTTAATVITPIQTQVGTAEDRRLTCSGALEQHLEVYPMHCRACLASLVVSPSIAAETLGVCPCISES